MIRQLQPKLAETLLAGWLAAVLVSTAACSARDDEAATDTSATTSSQSPSADTGDGDGAAGVPVLAPAATSAGGRYSLTLPTDKCDPASFPVGCPRTQPPPPLHVELDIPSHWMNTNDVYLAHTGADTDEPEGGSLILGIANYFVALNSDPCVASEDQAPDTKVGPSVQDFVDAVARNPHLDTTTPQPVTIDDHPGQFFTIDGPEKLGGACKVWRPWEPGIYAQGPATRWDVWALDIDGQRRIFVAAYFRGTSARHHQEFTSMVRSMTFERGA
jgi:hypothetical protein